MVETALYIVVSFLSILAYTSLVVFTTIGTHLYTFAYLKMKRSRIIGSLAILLGVLALDSVFWTFSEFYRLVHGVYPTVLLNPFALFLIKGTLAVAVIRFVLCSIRDDTF